MKNKLIKLIMCLNIIVSIATSYLAMIKNEFAVALATLNVGVISFAYYKTINVYHELINTICNDINNMTQNK